MPELTAAEELEMRARTIKLLADISQTPLIPSEMDIEGATRIAKEMTADPKLRPDYAKYPNETMAYLAGLVAQTKVQLVDELSELKLYVINKLIYEVEHANQAKDRIAALTKLGEVTHVIKPIEEVEKELSGILENIRGNITDAEYTQVVEPQVLEDQREVNGAKSVTG